LVGGYPAWATSACRARSAMAGNSNSSPAWSHGRRALVGQAASGAALTGSRRAGLPRRPSSRRGHPGRPSGLRSWPTVWGGTRRAARGGGPARVQAGRAAAAALVAAGQPGQPIGLEDLPDRLGGDRQAVGGERTGDLGDAVVLGAQPQDLGAQLPGGLARSLRSGLGLGKWGQLAGAQQGGHLMDGGGGVAVAVGHLRGGQVVDEVGAQSLVAALLAAGRLEEVCCARSQWVSVRILLRGWGWILLSQRGW